LIFLKDNDFVGYTFNRDIENERAPIVEALERLEMNKGSSRVPS
jgi:hypothetical protein